MQGCHSLIRNHAMLSFSESCSIFNNCAAEFGTDSSSSALKVVNSSCVSLLKRSAIDSGYTSGIEQGSLGGSSVDLRSGSSSLSCDESSGIVARRMQKNKTVNDKGWESLKLVCHTRHEATHRSGGVASLLAYCYGLRCYLYWWLN